jgi:hypothetical protein
MGREFLSVTGCCNPPMGHRAVDLVILSARRTYVRLKEYAFDHRSYIDIGPSSVTVGCAHNGNSSQSTEKCWRALAVCGMLWRKATSGRLLSLRGLPQLSDQTLELSIVQAAWNQLIADDQAGRPA